MFHALRYRAWSPEQKREILDALYKCWLMQPELRLGQLLLNAAESNLYYIEDYDLIEGLNSLW